MREAGEVGRYIHAGMGFSWMEDDECYRCSFRGSYRVLGDATKWGARPTDAVKQVFIWEVKRAKGGFDLGARATWPTGASAPLPELT